MKIPTTTLATKIAATAPPTRTVLFTNAKPLMNSRGA